MSGHPVVAVALGILTWGLIPHWQIVVGVAGIFAATLARFLLHRRARVHVDDADALRHATRTSTVVVAAAWGLLALVLLPQVASGIEARVLLFLAGLTAAGAGTHVADVRGFRLFAGLMLGPALAGVVANGYDMNTGADLVLIAVYWVTMVVIQRRTHRQLADQLSDRARLQRTTRQATQEKEFLDAVLDSAPDGLALLDPEGRIRRMNDLFRRMLWSEQAAAPADAPGPPDGAPPPPAPPPPRAGGAVDPRQLADFHRRGPLWDALIGVTQDLARAPSPRPAEREVVLDRAGRRSWYTVSAAPGRDEAAGWTVLQVEDISSLRRAEEDRREAKAEYSELVEAASDLIWRVDRHGRWTFLNQAAEGIYGVAPHTLLGHSIMDQAVAEHRNADYEALATVLDGGEIVEYETRHERADGAVRWLSFSARPVRDDEGRIVGAQGVARDVTSQVKGRLALERLAERNSLVRSLINASEDLIFYKDQRGVYQGCNDAFAHFVQLPEDEIVGYTDEDLYAPEEAALFKATDQEVLRTAQPWVGESWEEMGSDGERRLLETVKTPFVDADGTVLGILGIGRDVTARKEAEERLRLAADEARRATQMKSAFLANMSHEIRTPMNGVLGMAELLQGTRLDAEQRQYVDIVRSSAQNLLGILNDILDFSKIEAGHLELEAIPFDLAGEMADAIRVLSVHASEKRNELLLEVDPALPRWTLGDPVRLRQVVTNLLGNAVKFTEGGEVQLSLAVDEEPDHAGHPHRVRVEVRDTGIGIPQEKLPLIFEEFSQADSSVTRRFGGTGLGLTISRRLVELMGGEIGVESEFGAGSTFWFTVPLLRTEAPPDAASPPHPESFSLSGKRVLVVDDNATNRKILRRVLAEAGAVVEEAPDGVAGEERLRELHDEGHLPHLVVMDVQMPDVDGLEVVRRLRDGDAGGALARLPVVVLTSANRSEDTARARALGVEAYHLKPLPRRELLQVVGRILAGTGERRTVTGGETDGPGSRPSPTAAPLPAPAPRLDEDPARPRILLAEDNAVNRMVAETMLRKEGYHVVSAVDGAEAVERVRGGGIRMVFMDVQMPRVDGLEATRTIRGLPQPLGSIPIVALTAHALEEERQRCNAAGMDDFLSKPFHADDLLAALDRWIDDDRAVRAADGAGREAPHPTWQTGGSAEEAPPVDVEQFRASMDEAGIGEITEPTLAIFLSDLPARVTALERALDTGEAGEVAGAAHALKSSSANIRATHLADLLARLEQRARDGDLDDDVSELGTRIQAEAKRVRDFLTAR
jgi:PAS domain S-box-containing protein